MKNLEDIAFIRFCRYLENWKIEFKLDKNDYYCVYVDGNRVPVFKWQSKKNILIDVSYNQASFFHVCKSLNNIIAAGNEDVLWSNGICLANMYKRLKMIEADSYEEMLIKMDLAGV